MTDEESYWENIDNQRKFLENFANKNNFDPMIASNWYSVTSNVLLSYQVFLLFLYNLFILFIFIFNIYFYFHSIHLFICLLGCFFNIK